MSQTPVESEGSRLRPPDVLSPAFRQEYLSLSEVDTPLMLFGLLHRRPLLDEIYAGWIFDVYAWAL